MGQRQTRLGAIDLGAEIEIRSRATAVFDQIIKLLTKGLEADSTEDLDSLAVILAETREQIKLLKEQEEMIRTEIRKCFPGGRASIDLPSALIVLTPCERSGLDADAIRAEYGQAIIERFTKRTLYEKIQVFRK
jgi:hypothetical protein